MRIEVCDLSKTIRGIRILKNISLKFQSGNIYGIVGSNGSGKTMLLRAITGLLVPSSGKITVDGQILNKDISFPPKMGILIERPEFLEYLTGLQNLKLLAEIKGIASEEEIKYYMQWFGLDPNSKKTVRKYSQGMKQKLGVIQAIMEKQELLILDEPFNALDENTVNKFRQLLLEYKKQGRLIILTSHNKEDIVSLCDFTYQILDGEIVS